MEAEKEYFVIQSQTGRIDKVMTNFLPEATRSQIQSWIKNGAILVNNRETKANYKVQPGDEISFLEPEEEPLAVEAENMPLNILYEDEDLLVVNKPAGMVVHPSKGHSSGTLVNGLLYHANGLSEGTDYIRPGIVHRIDKDTSGLLVVAKNNTAHQKLAGQFQDHSIEREYTALVHGCILHEEGTIDAPISRMVNNRLKRTVAPGGKEAVTHFTKLEEFQNYTLLRLVLETGRTHQIRVHLQYIGHPIAGDPMYGPPESADPHGQYLHAGTLGFTHPTTGERMRFEVPLPDYFSEKLNEIQSSD